MRLIDADALDAEMYRKSFEVDDGRNVWNSGLWIRYKIYEEAIRDAPTVDAVPVRHGKWIHEVRYTIDSLHSYQQYRCSECGMTYITNTKYCPNCGADMRGDNSEHE